MTNYMFVGSSICPICRMNDYTCGLLFPNDEFDCDGNLDDKPEWCPLTEVTKEVRSMITTKHIGDIK